ncbi:beta subunit of N-acylethanolamine-hydrolyzing acid amidase-domain-containing protein [Penicillium odoratum]|uniref:beta subunit of N-acylethanolamine-hydrolyzing acid amidase-domain-containing protein n=1 Tax=Penicillium odoratum TaxID=1167516 RepID=UPI0025494440|nr:beta subunit of N-acylethanolamine-hydrolyzing acid amidase-domain-containing protein [Penicillium odoratum]KAJ5759737.1 beta subunit of N-acylethanolamine-hydrolyzing acid amidase-domain-containing protein [Penicillium odoratum]
MKGPDLKQLGEKPPIFRINLSLPPAERYVALATLYRDRMRSLRGMFDELITSISPKIPIRLIHKIAWLCLRKLHTREETEELRGISRATDIDMYLLICLNTVLDLLMGCTSGGVRVRSGTSGTKMLHFRTLDWGMDPLRDLIVQLEFIRDGDPKVVATSISYVGFVGVLTGVRRDLSVSLNFRPVHDTTRNCAFYANHIFVLLGLRQSISSLLRQCLLLPEPDARGKKSLSSNLADIVANIPHIPTTAAYLIFCDGSSTVTMEKDHRTAVVSSSSAFIVTTNHDQQPGSAPPEVVANAKRKNHIGLSLLSDEVQDLADLIEDSNERRECMQSCWDRETRKQNEIAGQAPTRKQAQSFAEPSGPRSSLRLRKRREEEQIKEEAEQRRIAALNLDDDSGIAVTEIQVLSWLTTFPVLNETTHYATIMDPSRGEVAWVRKYDASEWD